MASLQSAYQLVPLHRARPRLAAPPDRPTAAFVVRSARAMEWGHCALGQRGGDKFRLGAWAPPSSGLRPPSPIKGEGPTESWQSGSSPATQSRGRGTGEAGGGGGSTRRAWGSPHPPRYRVVPPPHASREEGAPTDRPQTPAAPSSPERRGGGTALPRGGWGTTCTGLTVRTPLPSGERASGAWERQRPSGTRVRGGVLGHPVCCSKAPLTPASLSGFAASCASLSPQGRGVPTACFGVWAAPSTAFGGPPPP